MSDVWDEFGDPLGERLADDLRQMVRNYENSRERSRQTAIGPSEIGSPCARCLARKTLGLKVTSPFADPWCAIIGTAVHSWLQQAAEFDNAMTLTKPDIAARWFAEQRVHPHPELLPAGGSVDLYDLETFTVIDHKILGVDSHREIRLRGCQNKLAYRYQGHIYGMGYERAGHRVDHVAIAAWKRGGFLRDLHVHTEPYDEAVAVEALNRYRIIREQSLALGAAILPHLPADESCFDCGGKDIDDESLSPNPARMA
jgi:hypothetical protein